MKIIGITGTIGAGKGTVVEYLVKNRGFKHFSAREFLVEEIEKRGMPVVRESMFEVANDLRAKNSPSFILDELYKRAKIHGGNAVLESIRTLGEIESLRAKENFYLLAIDAEAEKRYERIKLRGSVTDDVSFAKFLEEEKKEMESTNPNKQNLKRCIEAADFLLTNNKTFEDLYAQIEGVLEKINNQYN